MERVCCCTIGRCGGWRRGSSSHFFRLSYVIHGMVPYAAHVVGRPAFARIRRLSLFPPAKLAKLLPEYRDARLDFRVAFARTVKHAEFPKTGPPAARAPQAATPLPPPRSATRHKLARVLFSFDHLVGRPSSVGEDSEAQHSVVLRSIASFTC